MKKWIACFRAGLESLADNLRPGQAYIVITADLINKVEKMRRNCHVKLEMLVAKLDVSVGIVWTIVHDRLRFRKVFGH